MIMTNDNERRSSIPKAGLLVIAILVVALYIGMGVLFYCNFFGWVEWSPFMKVMNYVVATVLVLYGIYRAYRVIKGIGSPV